MGRIIHNNYKNILKVALIVYVLMLVYFLFFYPEFRNDNIINNYNISPFKTIKLFLEYKEYLGSKSYMLNIYGNILGFIPIGILFPILFEKTRKAYKIATTTFLISFVIETIQFLTEVGSFDIDDIILNTIGGIIGYGFFVAAKNMVKIKEVKNGK